MCVEIRGFSSQDADLRGLGKSHGLALTGVCGFTTESPSLGDPGIQGTCAPVPGGPSPRVGEAATRLGQTEAPLGRGGPGRPKAFVGHQILDSSQPEGREREGPDEAEPQGRPRSPSSRLPVTALQGKREKPPAFIPEDLEKVSLAFVGSEGTGVLLGLGRGAGKRQTCTFSIALWLPGSHTPPPLSTSQAPESRPSRARPRPSGGQPFSPGQVAACSGDRGREGPPAQSIRDSSLSWRPVPPGRRLHLLPCGEKAASVDSRS